jgi:predicted HTH transcriptional regulator
MAGIPKYISNLIAGGETQTLDFKFEISNAGKIAKTLVAFANTDGGTLLVGVKDNGKIAGIRTNEEVFMIESAANLFSRPKIKFNIKIWNIKGKQILEVKIPKGLKRPYFAKDTDNKWIAYVRVNDQNFKADKTLVKFWQEKDKRKVEIKYSRKEELLLNYLENYDKITLKEFKELAQITTNQALNTIVDFLILDIIQIKITEQETFFTLKNDTT